MNKKAMINRGFILYMLVLVCGLPCASVFSQESLETGVRKVMPDPTTDDGVCRILAIGHSFFAGENDLEKWLPEMLVKQKKWKTKLDFELLWGEHIYPTILVERGELPSSDNADSIGRQKKWEKIKGMLKENSYDYCLFLIGIGASASMQRSDGMGMLGAREIARTIHELSPKTVIIGFATWGGPKDTYEAFAQESDLNLDAWSQAAGSSVSIKVTKLGKEKNNNTGPIPGHAYLKKRWEEGGIDMFFAAPVALAWKNAYAEKGYGQEFVLHRSLKKRDAHGNIWGDYLKTCVYFSMITGERFDGRDFSSTISSSGSANYSSNENKTSIPDAIARYFEDTAFTAVTSFERMGLIGSAKDKDGSEGNKLQQQGPQILTVHRRFDEKGRLFSTQTLPDGVADAPIYRNIYDEKNAIIRTEVLSIDGQTVRGSSKFRTIYENGRLIRRDFLDEKGENIGSENFTYHPDGLIKTEYMEDKNGQVDARYVYNYEKGRLKEKQFFSATGDLAGKTTHEYDEFGRKIKALEEDADGEILFVETYQYKRDLPDEKAISFLRRDETTGNATLTFLEYDPKGNKQMVRVEQVMPAAKNKVISIMHYRNTYLGVE